MTPLHIEISIHYCTRTTDYGKHNGDDNFSAPAVQSFIRHFFKAGLLERNSLFVNGIPQAPEYIATEGLKLWVETLKNVPFPIQQWIIPK